MAAFAESNGQVAGSPFRAAEHVESGIGNQDVHCFILLGGKSRLYADDRRVKKSGDRYKARRSCAPSRALVSPMRSGSMPIDSAVSRLVVRQI
jgi:hypothetical protein